jgi:hypothetical protein
MSRVSSLVLALLLCAIAAMVPGRAFASPGGINAVFTPFNYTDTSSCSFPLQVQGESYDTFVLNPQQTSFKIHFHGSGTVSADGVTYKFFFDGSVEFTSDGQIITSGLQEHVNVPGAGLVIADIGHLVQTYDPVQQQYVFTLVAGQHDFSVSQYPGLCQYFP